MRARYRRTRPWHTGWLLPAMPVMPFVPDGAVGFGVAEYCPQYWTTVAAEVRSASHVVFRRRSRARSAD